jgi:hypothetical protein
MQPTGTQQAYAPVNCCSNASATTPPDGSCRRISGGNVFRWEAEAFHDVGDAHFKLSLPNTIPKLVASTLGDRIPDREPAPTDP